MSLFGSGPRSNILQTVAPMYQGIVNAEKQKGASMREAMGAFGQAIDPKTIAMKKFKKDFANADWNKPETHIAAAQALMGTDPQAAYGFLQGGQSLAKSQATKSPEYVKVETVDEKGNPIIKYMTKAEAAQTGTFGKYVEPKADTRPSYTTQTVMMDGKPTIIQFETGKYNPNDPTTYTVVGEQGYKPSDPTPVKRTATVSELQAMGANVSGLNPQGRYEYNVVGDQVNILGMQTGTGEKPAVITAQWTGMDLQHEGIEVEDVTALYNVELTPSGRPTIKGKVAGTGTAAADRPTAMARRISEAYGYEVGTPEHQAEMQKAIDSQNTVKNIPSAMEQVITVKKDVEKNKRWTDMTATAAMIDDGKALLPAVKAGNAKAGVILEKIGSQLSASGVRAVSEIQRYTESGSWSQRMGDWINRGFKGTPSDISIEETEKLLNLLNDKNNTRMNLFLDHQTEVFSGAMKDRTLLHNTINAFRPELDSGVEFDVTSGLIPIPNAPSGLEDGTHIDAEGNKIQVINGVAYEF